MNVLLKSLALAVSLLFVSPAFAIRLSLAIDEGTPRENQERVRAHELLKIDITQALTEVLRARSIENVEMQRTLKDSAMWILDVVTSPVNSFYSYRSTYKGTVIKRGEATPITCTVIVREGTVSIPQNGCTLEVAPGVTEVVEAFASSELFLR